MIEMNGTVSIVSPSLSSSLAGVPSWQSLFKQLADEVPAALSGLLVPTVLLYASIYSHVRGFLRLYRFLTVASIACFFAVPWLSAIHCGPLRCLQNFASTQKVFI